MSGPRGPNDPVQPEAKPLGWHIKQQSAWRRQGLPPFGQHWAHLRVGPETSVHISYVGEPITAEMIDRLIAHLQRIRPAQAQADAGVVWVEDASPEPNQE